jgi:carboxypeptidase Taq
MKEHYQKLVEQQTRLNRLNHLKEIAFWDQATHMSEKGIKSRADAVAELSQIIYEIECNENTEIDLKKAQKEHLSDIEHANVQEIERKFKKNSFIPKDLIKKKQIATSICEHEWRKQKPSNDWKGFLSNFKEVVHISRVKADILSQKLGISPYEALMDDYEPNLKEDTVNRCFEDIKTWMPTLLNDVMKKQKTITGLVELTGPFESSAQKNLNLEIMSLLGFDFQAGRLDESAHPFCGGNPQDVRITTRFNQKEFLSSLMGTIHETGHARYEQNLPYNLLEQPVGQARSMSIHESQSLFFEKHIGCSAQFIKRVFPLIKKHLGSSPSLALDNLQSLNLRVKPSFIRVDADEITYPAHIIIRYEIEKELINTKLEISELPELWNTKMDNILGISPKDDFKNGILQDVHWPEGLFGYFPCYTLGALYAAQWAAMIKQTVKDYDEIIEHGDLTKIFNWLDINIWKKASILQTDALTKSACKGESLNPRYFKNYLEQKFLN